MAEYQGGIKISQLDDVNRINDNDIVPFTNNDMGDSQTRKIRLDSLRQHLNYSFAYNTNQEGLSNTIPGQIFHVFTDETKLEVNSYRNEAGVAVIIKDSDGIPYVGTTGNFLSYLKSPLGYSAIGKVNSFSKLRTLKPPYDGAVIELSGYEEGGVTGAGGFVGRIGVGADDTGIIAAGDGFYWERTDLSSGIGPHLFGYVSGSGKDVTNELNRSIFAAERLGRSVVFLSGFKMSINQAGIQIPKGVDLLVSHSGTAYFEITHEIETTSQFVLGSRNKISNLSFHYAKQTNDLNVKPIIRFGPLFSGAGYYSRLTNINIGNAYYGFKIGGTDEGSASYITMRDINGAPLYRGVSLDRCLDIPRISDIHFNYNLYLGTPDDYKTNLRQWMLDNGTAFHFGRVDFADVQRIFGFGYSKGILLQGERYTGSSDSIRFSGCDMDICVNPIYARNFGGQLVIRNGKYTGVGTPVNGLIAPETGCFNYFQRVVPAGRVILDTVTMNNYDKDAIRTGCDMVVTGSRIYAYGTDKQQRAAIAIITDSNANLVVDKTVIDATGDQNRGIAGIGTTGQLTISVATEINNAGLEGYRWLPGFALVEGGCKISGPSRNSVSFINEVRKDFYADSMPVAGGGYVRGDKIWLSGPVVGLHVTQARYTIMGWERITNSNPEGTNHEINVDWVEIRTPIDPLPKVAMSGTTRPTVTTIGFQFFDTGLKKPIYLSSVNPVVWVDSTGTVV